MEASWYFWFSAWLMIRACEKFWSWTNNADEVAIKLDKFDKTEIWFILSLVAISTNSHVSLVYIFDGPFHYDQPRNNISFHFARNDNYCKQNFFHGGTKFDFGYISFRISCEHPLNLFISVIELRTFLYLITYLFIFLTYLFI